jgi:hypothetical protein
MAYQKYLICYILDGLGMGNVDIFYCFLVYFVAICNILWPFGIFLPILVCCTSNNLATLLGVTFSLKNIFFSFFQLLIEIQDLVD